MISIRKKADRWIQKVTGGMGPNNAELVAKSSSYKLEVVWGIVLGIVVAITVFIGLRVGQSQKVQLTLAAMWGLFIGMTLLLFLPAKFLITLVGVLLGTGATDLAGLSENIKKTAAGMADIVSVLNSSLASSIVIYPASGWIILVLIILCCIPAYKNVD